MAVLLERNYGTSSQSGAREDLSDLISNVDARSTVFTSLAKKGKKPGNVVMSWQMDKHDEADITAYLDGTDVDMTQASATNRGDNAVFGNPAASRALAQNYAQMFRRTFRIGNLANEIQVVAGVKSELANGIAKKLVSLKRDMETVFLSDQDAASEAAGTGSKDGSSGSNLAPVGYTTKALGSFLRRAGIFMAKDADSGEVGTASNHGLYTQFLSDETATYAAGDAGGILGSPFRVNENFVTPLANCYEGTSAAFNEEAVQNVLKGIYDTTGVIRDYDAIIGTVLKRKFTDMTQRITSSNEAASPVKVFNQNASEKSFINAIDLFEGDFGRLRLHPSTFITELSQGPLGKTASGTVTAHACNPASALANFKGYVIPFDQVEIRYGKLPEIKELTDNGGGPARLIQAIAALVINNPQNFGYFDCDNVTAS